MSIPARSPALPRHRHAGTLRLRLGRRGRARQSRRGDAYAAALLARPVHRRPAYPCACTRRELADQPLRAPRLAPLPGHLPRRPAAGRRPRLARARAEGVVRFCDGYRANQEDLATPTPATTWSTAPTALRLSARRGGGRRRGRRIPRRAAPICSGLIRPRVRSTCSASSPAGAAYAHLPLATNAAGEALRQTTGARDRRASAAYGRPGYRAASQQSTRYSFATAPLATERKGVHRSPSPLRRAVARRWPPTALSIPSARPARPAFRKKRLWLTRRTAAPR